MANAIGPSARRCCWRALGGPRRDDLARELERQVLRSDQRSEMTGATYPGDLNGVSVAVDARAIERPGIGVLHVPQGRGRLPRRDEGTRLPADELPHAEFRGAVPGGRVGLFRKQPEPHLGAVRPPPIPSQEAVRSVLGSDQQRHPVAPGQEHMDHLHHARPRTAAAAQDVPLPRSRFRVALSRVDDRLDASQRHCPYGVAVLGPRHPAAVRTSRNGYRSGVRGSCPVLHPMPSCQTTSPTGPTWCTTADST